MDALEACKLFSGLSPADLRTLQESVCTRKYGVGQEIFREGELGDGIYVVGEGRVEISACVVRDERKTLSVLGEGEIFGEMAVVDDEPRSATATAEVDCTVYFIPRQVLLTILQGSPLLAVNLVREFSRRMRDFDRQYVRELLQSERLAVIGQFARSIVHDLKNPLNIIGIAAEFLSTDGVSPEAQRTVGPRIQRQVERLNRMVKELLEFTRGSQGSVVLAELNFADVMERALDDVREEISNRGVQLHCQNQPPDVGVLLDPSRFCHLIHNLVSNSLDVVPSDGRITFRFSADPGSVVTEVEDTGPGIPEEILPHLFEPFTTHGKPKGTGLGLSICRKIVQDHQGQITAHNTPGGGAVFRIVLPAAGSAPSAPSGYKDHVSP